MRLAHERRRDDQQWIFDWKVKDSGRVQNFAYDHRDLPAAVKSYHMIPKHMGRQGHHQEEIARGAEKKGHQQTAVESYWRAINSYHAAQHAIYHDDDPEKLRLYQRIRECYDRIVALSEYPIEIIEVPWEGEQIQCTLHLQPSREKVPTVLFIPGMDMTKEARFPDPQKNPAIARGMNMLIMDGPGQGMSNVRKIRVGHDNYERAASTVIDYLLTRPEVDPDRLGICGVSMGSFWGIRTAALDDRIRALATSASCFGDKTAIFNQASPRFKRVFMYMAGVHDEETFDAEIAAHMTTSGFGAKISCPTLLIQGEFDPLCPLEDTQQLFEELAGPKELWILEDDFHGIWGLPGLGGMDTFPFMMDWIKDTMNHGLPADHRQVRSILPSTGPGPYSA